MSWVQKALLVSAGCLVFVCCLLSFQSSVRRSANRPASPPSEKNELDNNQLHFHSRKPKNNHYKFTTSVSKVGDVCRSKIGNFSDFASTSAWKKFQTLLEDYKRFHRVGIEKLKRGDSSVRTLTWSCYNPKECSGTGDQFDRIKQVFLLAIMSRRVFTIYWDEESLRTMHYLQPNKINWNYFNKEAGMKIAHDPKVGHNCSKLYNALMSQNRKHMTINQELRVPLTTSFFKKLSSCNIVNELDKIGFTPVFRKTAPMALAQGEIVRYLFKFSTSVIKTVNAMQKSLGLFDKPYLAVHIRTGFLGTGFEEHGKFPKHKVFRNSGEWESTLKCSVSKATKSIGPNAPLYLATDSYLVKQLAAEKYGSRIRQVNMTLQHVAFLKQSKSDQNSESVIIDGYLATWIDLLLLARASVLVRSISMFSSLAGEVCSVREQYYIPKCKTHY